MDKTRIKEYALKTYPKLFTKKRLVRDAKGKIASVAITNYDPVVIDGDSHWRIYAHLDGSPLILSKNI